MKDPESEFEILSDEHTGPAVFVIQGGFHENHGYCAMVVQHSEYMRVVRERDEALAALATLRGKP